MNLRGTSNIQHDITVLNQMPDPLVCDSMTDLTPTPVSSNSSKSSSSSKKH